MEHEKETKLIKKNKTKTKKKKYIHKIYNKEKETILQNCKLVEYINYAEKKREIRKQKKIF